MDGVFCAKLFLDIQYERQSLHTINRDVPFSFGTDDEGRPGRRALNSLGLANIFGYFFSFRFFIYA